MKISEIFYSRQGEGPETGILVSEYFSSIQGEGPEISKPAFFIRLAKCNLTCRFCDTPYALYGGKKYSVNKLVKIIKEQKNKHIIWTGGEPALQIKKIKNIINKLKNYKHSIETNGTFPFNTKLFKTIVISPKKQAINKELINKYKKQKNVYFKFVVENLKNYEFWKNLIKKLKIPKKKTYFMPEAKNKKTLIQRSKWLIKKIKQDGFNFSNRLQILKEFR